MTVSTERILVQLKANVAQRVPLSEVDCSKVEINIRYTPLSEEKYLSIFFVDSDGRRAGEPVELPTDGQLIHIMDLSDPVFERTPSTIFNGIEFKSDIDFNFEFRIVEPEVSF